jgi:hypothetical protein
MKKWMVFLGTLAVVAVVALTLTGAVLAQGPQGSERHMGFGRGAGFVDADGDGVCDRFVDEDGDGVCDRFVDEDGDGICDLHGSGQGYGRGYGFVDEDGDGVCDRFVDEDGDGVCDLHGTGQGYGSGRGFVDEDGDGVCDYSGTAARMGQGSRGERMGGRWSSGQ